MDLMVLHAVVRDGFPSVAAASLGPLRCADGTEPRPASQLNRGLCTAVLVCADESGATVGLVITDWRPSSLFALRRPCTSPDDSDRVELVRMVGGDVDRPAGVEHHHRLFEFELSGTERRRAPFLRVRFPTVRSLRAAPGKASKAADQAEKALDRAADAARAAVGTADPVAFAARAHAHAVCQRRADLAASLGEAVEHRVAPESQLLGELGVAPCGWLRVGAPGDELREPEFRVTTCTREHHISMDRLRALPERDDVAPVMIASVDIECRTGDNGAFPKATRDPIICIGTVLARPGRAGYEQRRSVIHCLRDCDAMDGVELHDGYDCELAMLEAWRDTVVQADVAVMIGYNTTGFDYRYMVERHNTLVDRRHAELADGPAESERGWAVSPCVSCRFRWLSFMAAQPAEARAKTLSSAAMGYNELFEVLCAGRTSLDLLLYVKTNYALSRYTLDAVATHFVGDQKIPISHDDVRRYFETGPAERALYCVYCVQDCALPLQLCAQLAVLEDYVQTARVQRTQLADLVSRGQQIRVFNMLLHAAHRDGFVIDREPQRNAPPALLAAIAASGRPAAASGAKGYEGATVLEPTPGFYRCPIATLDFASLYPSIMRAHNLCYSTLWTAAGRPPAWLGTETHGDTTFVTDARFRGVLPRMLDELLAERKATKRLLAREPDASARARLDKKQLAQKVAANSVYGFTGAVEKGMYPCKEVAATVTSRGRDYIARTRAMVMEDFGFDVIYGDTDSVMVKLPLPEAEAFARATEIAEHITARFPEAIVLEDEKVYNPYLLKGKKRYAGRKKETLDGKASLDTKGIEMVRRDNAPLARDVQREALTRLIMEDDAAGAIEGVRRVLHSVVSDEAPFGSYVITKAIAESYKTEALAHVQVAKKMERRGTPVPTGGRVEYVISRAPGKLFEKAEEAAYARRVGLLLDRHYYLEKQIMTPLRNLLGDVMHLEPLFHGALHALERQYQHADRARFAQACGMTHDARPPAIPDLRAEAAQVLASAPETGNARTKFRGAGAGPGSGQSTLDQFLKKPRHT